MFKKRFPNQQFQSLLEIKIVIIRFNNDEDLAKALSIKL